ncbi:MAG TPA: dTDP-4-dehydrorhamnose 3,5-epimerase [Candidatus Aquilonibacter sp.]|nr:dTDP-4-dehydrorhamnose 3,5-epimerase [Candidatus Aquilonibacter sp.]
MKFRETALPGLFEIDLEPMSDERGFFARSWCRREFELHGLNPETVQCDVSYNKKRGTLRGLHYQTDPHPEAKLVRCTQGSIYDVAVDLRRDSPTFKHWVGVTLSAPKRNMIYIPEGFAHGFLTLEDETEIFYQMSEFYHPELSRGVRWDDPAFGVVWPGAVKVISERDRTYPDFESSR